MSNENFSKRRSRQASLWIASAGFAIATVWFLISWQLLQAAIIATFFLAVLLEATSLTVRSPVWKWAVYVLPAVGATLIVVYLLTRII